MFQCLLYDCIILCVPSAAMVDKDELSVVFKVCFRLNRENISPGFDYVWPSVCVFT